MKRIGLYGQLVPMWKTLTTKQLSEILRLLPSPSETEFLEWRVAIVKPFDWASGIPEEGDVIEEPETFTFQRKTIHDDWTITVINPKQ